ncbi:hypothetical protein [Microcoleus sp. bin38.metabat.b11b12b14.051]|nr:hypothetical protein [Microcoleus sp. bin38.metabat.b11b12b14.051]
MAIIDGRSTSYVILFHCNGWQNTELTNIKDSQSSEVFTSQLPITHD